MLWGLAVAFAAECAAPAHNIDVAVAVDDAMARYAQFDVEGFAAGVDEASALASCLVDVIEPKVAGALHRARGLSAFLAKDFGSAELHFAAARLADPEHTWPESIAPTDGPLLRRYTAVPIDEGLPLPKPSTGALRVDGTLADTRPDGVPALLQSVDRSGRTRTTYLVAPSEPLPLDRMRYRRPGSVPLWVTSAVLGAAAAGALGVAGLNKAAFDAAATDLDEERIRSSAAASRGWTVAAGVLGVGSGATLGLGFAFR
jgi:hypothetical protein